MTRLTASSSKWRIAALTANLSQSAATMSIVSLAFSLLMRSAKARVTGLAGRNRATAERTQTGYEPDSVGFDASRDLLLSAFAD
jgi:hypothetical protein